MVNDGHVRKVRKGTLETMTLTKSDIVNELASIGKGTIFTRRESADLVESLLEIIKQTLESGEDVLINGFGKFCVKDKRGKKRKKSSNRARSACGSKESGHI